VQQLADITAVPPPDPLPTGSGMKIHPFIFTSILKKEERVALVD
jgi:hypothetical protein